MRAQGSSAGDDVDQRSDAPNGASLDITTAVRETPRPLFPPGAARNESPVGGAADRARPRASRERACRALPSRPAADVVVRSRCTVVADSDRQRCRPRVRRIDRPAVRVCSQAVVAADAHPRRIFSVVIPSARLIALAGASMAARTVLRRSAIVCSARTSISAAVVRPIRSQLFSEISHARRSFAVSSFRLADPLAQGVQPRTAASAEPALPPTPPATGSTRVEPVLAAAPPRVEAPAPLSPPPPPPPRPRRGRIRTFVVRFARGVLLLVLAGGSYIAYRSYTQRHPGEQLGQDPTKPTIVGATASSFSRLIFLVLGSGWASTSFLKDVDNSCDVGPARIAADLGQ